MSNVYTSFIRIQRRDHQEMSEIEMASIFNKVVNVHDSFGSYWVRIVQKYRKREKCFDIQFGSGKRFQQLDSLEDFAQYHVWERINYEGGIDRFFTFHKSEDSKVVFRTAPEPCQYGFDKIIMTSDENWLAEFGGEAISSSQFEFRLKGCYNACNSRAFVDVYDDSEFYGPRLFYTDDYPYDFFVLIDSEEVIFREPSFLSNLSKSHLTTMPNQTKLEFLWQNRKVLVIRKNYDIVEFQTADFWDNCINETYLNKLYKNPENNNS